MCKKCCFIEGDSEHSPACGPKPVRAEFDHTFVAFALVGSQQVGAVSVCVGQPGHTELSMAIIRCAYPIILDKAGKLQCASNTSRESDPCLPPPANVVENKQETNSEPARQSPAHTKPGRLTCSCRDLPHEEPRTAAAASPVQGPPVTLGPHLIPAENEQRASGSSRR